MNWMNGVSTSLLEKGLDGTWTRQKATQANLANYETPGYKKLVVDFGSQLRDALTDRKNRTSSERARDVLSADPVVSVERTLTLRADGNNVDIEEEGVELARAQIQYAEYTRQLSDHFTRLRNAISGTSR